MKEADEREPPFFFQKPHDAVVGDGAVVPYPADTTDFQDEVELVAAIGKDGRNVDAASALEHVWGYGIGIDLTRRGRQRDMRDLQLPWEAGKSLTVPLRAAPSIQARGSAILRPAPSHSASTARSISAATSKR
jgi:fumarylpyruvate hydrolase